jgi:nitrogen fixation protein NifX
MSFLVAVASSDGEQIDRHFGHSDVFYIVSVGDDGTYAAKGKREVASPCRHGSHDENVLQETAEALADCRYVLAEAIGRGAEAHLKVRGITPLEADGEIQSAVEQVIIYDRRLHGQYKKV